MGAAVIGGAISAGILVPRINDGPEVLPPPTVSPTPFIEPCGVEPEKQVGELTLFFGGFEVELNATQLDIVENDFVDVYNNVSDGCEDRFQRHLQWASIINQVRL